MNGHLVTERLPVPGDVVLFADATPDFAQRLIHWATRSRFNHAAIVIGPNLLAEATAGGVSKAWITDKDLSELTVIAPLYDDQEDRLTAIAWARARLGLRYGYLNAFMCGVNNFLVGWKLAIKRTDAIICSELVAEALERAGFDFGKDSSQVSPGDLATFFGVSR